MVSPSKSRAAYDVLTLPSLATIIFAYQGPGVSMSLALAFQKHKTKFRQLFSRPMNNAVETFRGYVLCKLVAAKDVKLALELLAAFPERDMLALPPTNKKYVYAIDNAVRLQSVPLLTKLLERDFGKSSKAAMDAAAADGNLAMVQLLHEYRDDGCTYNAFAAAKKDEDHALLAFLRLARPRDERVPGPVKLEPIDVAAGVAIACTIQ